MQHEKRRKPLKILDSRLYMWLNESIINGEDYSIIYQLSIELDELIAQYYEILTKNSWLKYFYSI